MNHDIVRDVLDDLCCGVDTIPTGPVAAALLERLRVLAEGGDQDAEHALEMLLQEGCKKRVQRYSKHERIVPAVSHDGRMVSVSMRGGVPKRDSSTGDRVVWFEQTLFSAMSWADFDDYINDLVRQVQALSDKVRLLRRFESLRDEYPDSHGPGDAAVMAGTSLESILRDVREAS